MIATETTQVDTIVEDMMTGIETAVAIATMITIEIRAEMEIGKGIVESEVEIVVGNIITAEKMTVVEDAEID